MYGGLQLATQNPSSRSTPQACERMCISPHTYIIFKNFTNLVLVKRTSQASSQWHVRIITQPVQCTYILQTPHKPSAPSRPRSFMARHSSPSFTLSPLGFQQSISLIFYIFIFENYVYLCGGMDSHGVINSCDQPSLGPLPEVCTRARPFPSPIHCDSSNHLLYAM